MHITECLLFSFFLFFFTKNTPMLVIEKCNPLYSFITTVCLCQKSAALQKSLVTTLTQKLAVLSASLPPSGHPHTFTHLYGHRDQEGEKNEIPPAIACPYLFVTGQKLFPMQSFTYYLILVKLTEQ